MREKNFVWVVEDFVDGWGWCWLGNGVCTNREAARKASRKIAREQEQGIKYRVRRYVRDEASK